MAEVKEHGRFYYIEPNNLDGGPDNAIPFPYEDYCLSVNLEVSMKQRISTSSDDGASLYFASDNGTLSFFGGSGNAANNDNKQGFLTTNWTDVSNQNVGSGNKECLGIESIKVQFHSWYFPMVTIKFVDVRGAALMMPQEQAYFNEVSKDNKDITQLAGGSFFKSLFTFPYPEFILRIKGYYGKEVSYKLAVAKQQLDFDSENGNFTCTVDFKGYMFGVYTDVPMTYVAVAPYMNDMAYWNAQIASGRFKFKTEAGKDGADMITFPELRAKITEGISQIEKKASESPEGQSYQAATDQKDGLQALLDTFHGFITVGTGGWVGMDTSGDNGTSIFLRLTDTYSMDDSAKDGITAAGIIKSAKDYDTSHTSEGAEFASSLSDLSKHIGYKGAEKDENAMFIPDYRITRGKKDPNGNYSYTIEKMSLASDGKSFKYNLADDMNISDFLTTYDSVKDRISSNALTYFTKITTNLEKELLSRIKNQEKTLEEVNKSLGELKLKTLSEMLGFNLSIENVYRLVFAHLETFMYSMFAVSDSVKNRMDSNDTTRAIDKFGGIKWLNLPDWYKGTIVPPWPLVTKETSENGVKHNVIQWPANVVGYDIDETNFVKELLKAGSVYSAAEEKARQELEAAVNAASATTNDFSSDVTNFIPTTLYDFTRGQSDWNPYKDIADYKSASPEFAARTVTTFFLRAFYFFSMFRELRGNGLFKLGNVGKKYFGTAEAANFKKGIGTINTDCKNALLSYTADKAWSYMTSPNGSAVWNITGQQPPLSEGDKASKVWKTGKYQWLANSDSYGLPIATYNIDEIKKDFSGGDYLTNGKYLILGSNNRPIETVGSTSVNTTMYRIDDSSEDYWNTLIDNIKADDTIKKIEKVDKVFKIISGKDVLEGKTAYTNYFVQLSEIDKTNKSCTGTMVGLDSISTADTSLLCVSKDSKVDNKELSNPQKWMGIGSWNGTLDLHTPFNRPIYYAQNEGTDAALTLYRKAYIFAFSMPINKEYHKAFMESANASAVKAEFLRLGAYFWRLKYAGDPIKYRSMMSPMDKDEVPLTNNGESLLFRANGLLSGNYPKFSNFGTLENYSDAKIEKLITYFKEWAEGNEFASIRKCYELNPSDIKTITDEKSDSTYDYRKELISQEGQGKLVKFMASTITPIDCSRMDIDKASDNLKNVLTDAWKIFLDTIKDEYVNDSVETSDATQSALAEAMDTEMYNDEDLRKSTYINLQDLYNKWLCGKDRRFWTLDNDKSDFKDFQFIDSCYNDISQRFLCNPTQIRDLLGQVLPTEELAANGQMKAATYEGKSVYEFLTDIAEKNGMTLYCVPTQNGLNVKASPEGVREMFTPHSYLNNSKYVYNNGDEGETYTCIYAYKPSNFLDIKDDSGLYLYEDDSFDIADIHGHDSPTLPTTLQHLDTSAKAIPAFGVTYGKQNQSMFKSISLSTSDKQVTEQSIMMTQQIAAQAGENRNETMFFGQDIYRVYSNNNYSCTVECMGNAQIMPMMYFQLNGIPMWRGAYMITSVEHDIVAGNMVTRFTGTRQSKYAVPLAAGGFITVDDTGQEQTWGSSNGTASSSHTTGAEVDGAEAAEEAAAKYQKNLPPTSPNGFDVERAMAVQMGPMTLHPDGKPVVYLPKGPANNTTSVHRCSEAVQQAINGGGLKCPHGNAKDMIGKLPTIGFEAIKVFKAGTSVAEEDAWVKANAQAGDVAVMSYGTYGHICMYNTKVNSWVSDFKHSHIWVYSKSENPPRSDVYVFRYTGNKA